MTRVTTNRSRRRDTRRHSGAEVTLLHGEVGVPEPDEHWSEATKAEWGGYWRSEVAKLATDETVPVVRRLHDLRDERRLLWEGVRRSGARLTAGHKGQPRANPLYRVVNEIDAEIRMLEDRLGLSPLSRLQLGVALGDAGKALDALNAEFEADEADAEPEPDPRRAAIDVREP
jgi:P27 family predicted phage terminase small subunit